MHPDQTVIKIEIPVNDEKKMEDFQALMEEWQNTQICYEQEVANKLGISIECAIDVCYLRTRSRWTPEKEKELIRLHAEGKPPNVLSGEF